jgi:hypothetical protein
MLRTFQSLGIEHQQLAGVDWTDGAPPEASSFDVPR